MGQENDAIVVGNVSSLRRTSSSSKAVVRPNKLAARRSPKVAQGSFSLRQAGGYGGGGMGGGLDVMMGQATNIYSPHLSTDFLELPQNRTERNAYFRHFYQFDPYVQTAVNLHTELPLSKIRLQSPNGRDPKKNQEILVFFEDMVRRIKLLQKLVQGTKEFLVVGEALFFAEDSEVDFPEDLEWEDEQWIGEDGVPTTRRVRKSEEQLMRDKIAYYQKHYKGLKALRIMPNEQVFVTSLSYVDEALFELLPDPKIKSLVERAEAGDDYAEHVLRMMPQDLVDRIRADEPLYLATDPEEGSFIYQLARNKMDYEEHGHSIMECLMHVLVYRDKLRQAQTSIASRAMTPKRLVYGEDLSLGDVEDLRDQVDMALMDPDYTIVTNYQVSWEEISARDRLLDLGGEYDITDRQLFAGLGVTESMLTGESSYSGERLNIEVINTRYMLYRELIQEYVEEYLFIPVARRKGFIEFDEFGNERVLYPKLSFTRLALRDNRDTFDAMFNLYQKGSMPIDVILELLNLDPQSTRERLERDLFTVNDPVFNDMIRGIYNEVGRWMVESTDIKNRLADYLQVNEVESGDEGGRF